MSTKAYFLLYDARISSYSTFLVTGSINAGNDVTRSSQFYHIEAFLDALTNANENGRILVLKNGNYLLICVACNYIYIYIYNYIYINLSVCTEKGEILVTR